MSSDCDRWVLSGAPAKRERDEIAERMLAAIVSGTGLTPVEEGSTYGEDAELLVDRAYELADALLDARMVNYQKQRAHDAELDRQDEEKRKRRQAQGG